MNVILSYPHEHCLMLIIAGFIVAVIAIFIQELDIKSCSLL